MTAAPTTAAPALPGYRHVRFLAHGGFSHVHVYLQEFPRREVAVKVLHSSEGTDLTQFIAEANRMAGLSTHSHIVQIHDAGFSGDGRPYLVMEYCSGETLARLCRERRLPVADVLRYGIEVSGAVESVHQAGVLHRDIKPANVLTTATGQTKLTDFGISVAASDTSLHQGMSLPYAAPEQLKDDVAADVRSDVWSLGATVHALLVGHSPFSDQHVKTDDHVLMHRILHGTRPRTGRPDVPDSLERLLDQAMSKDPRRRFPSAQAFARALQDVQEEVRQPLTTISVVARGADLEEDDGRTRVRPPLVVDLMPDPARRPQTPQHRDHVRDTAPQGLVPGPVPGPGSPQEPDLTATVDRPPSSPPSPDAELRREAPRVRRAWPLVLGGALLVAAAVVALVIGLGRKGAPSTTHFTRAPAGAGPVLPVPAPSDVQVRLAADGSATVAWQPADGAGAGSTYLWGLTSAQSTDQLTSVAGASATVPAAQVAAARQASGQVCVQVATRAGDGRTSTPVSGCA